MSVLTFKKALSVGIGLLLFSQTALASLSESSFWEERRSRFSSQESSNDSKALASLPSSLSNPNQFNPNNLIKQMPSIGSSLPAHAKWKKLSKIKNGKISSELNEVINSIPLGHSRIQEVYDSGNDKNSPVVIIQDVHLNPEAQSNIATVIQELIDQDRVAMVGVEGAFDKLNFAPIRNLPEKEITRKVAQAFLDKKFLAAPSYVGITSQKEPPLFLGVDDPLHHKANVDAYLSTRKTREKTIKELDAIKRNLIVAKREFFSPEFKKYDDYRAAYQRGQIGIGLYVKRLTQYEIDTDLAIELFLEAYALETSLNFKRVERERKVVIEKLANTLDKNTLSNLLTQSVAYRMGRLSFGDYYHNLKNLCKENGIDLRKTPAFDDYIRYVLLSDGIRAEDLFQSINQLEEGIQNTLGRSKDEFAIAEFSKQVGLIEKLIDFQLTPTEWTVYTKGNRDLNSIQESLLKLIDVEPVQQIRFIRLAPYEAFYHEAEIRSEKMVDKLVNHPIDGNRVLVTGGFHTPEIAQLLKEQERSYIVVTPKITKIENEEGTSYLSVFAREKTPLERLFVGEKLFVSPTSVQVNHPRVGIPLATAPRHLSGEENPIHTVWNNEPIDIDVPPNFTHLDQYKEHQTIWIYLRDSIKEFFATHTRSFVSDHRPNDGTDRPLNTKEQWQGEFGRLLILEWEMIGGFLAFVISTSLFLSLSSLLGVDLNSVQTLSNFLVTVFPLTFLGLFLGNVSGHVHYLMEDLGVKSLHVTFIFGSIPIW